MTQQPISAAFLRGAVDLSSLGRPAAEPSAAGAADAVVKPGTDANFNDVVNASMTVPAVVVLWSQQLPASGEFVDVVADVARAYEGRFQVVSVDVDANPGLLQAFQVQSVPVTLGLIQGQPVPLFAGAQSAEHVRAYVDELLKLAAAARGHRPRRRRSRRRGGRRRGAGAAAAAPAGVRGDRARRPRRRGRRLRAGAEGEPGRRRGVARAGPGAADAAHRRRRPAAARAAAAADTHRRRRPRSSSPTSTCSADTSRTPSAAWSRPCATPAMTSATPPASTCSSCSRSSGPATSASCGPGAPSPAPCSDRP